MKKFDEESSNYTKRINKTLGDNSMNWKICCNNLGKQKITFQSFLNVLKLRESPGKEDITANTTENEGRQGGEG